MRTLKRGHLIDYFQAKEPLRKLGGHGVLKIQNKMVNEQEKSQILHYPTFVFRKTHKYSNSFSVLAHNSGCLLHFPAKFCAGNCCAVGQNWSLWACLTMDRCVGVTRLHVLTVNQWQDDRAEWRLCIRKTSTRKTDFELVACLIFLSVACRRLLPPLLSFYRTERDRDRLCFIKITLQIKLNCVTSH